MENFLKQFFFDCSLLKILSMNKFTGVLGVYNCQGAACSSTEIKNAFHQTTTETLTGTIRGRDVHLITEVATDPNWDDNCAFYYHQTGELITLPYNAALSVSLKVLEHDIFTVTPNQGFSTWVQLCTPGAN
jgi:raffinose synthase